MAKRSRVGGRPGQRRPLQRPAGRPTSSRPAAETPTVRPAETVTPEEMTRAAQLEAAIVAQERAADEAQRRDRRSRTAGEAGPSLPLAARAAEEYAYVMRDIRRIVVVGGSLLLGLFALFVATNVLNLL